MTNRVLDTAKLKVGQDVYMRSGQRGEWGTVVDVTPVGAIVQSDAYMGCDELIRFDKYGEACDSSDITVERYKHLILFRGANAPAPCDRDLDLDRLKNVVARSPGVSKLVRSVGNTDNDDWEFRQRVWENFECFKKDNSYRKIPGTDGGPWRLYWNMYLGPPTVEDENLVYGNMNL